MVLYKRKPIILPDPKPLPLDLNVNVWHIDETGEWFLTYREFLERMDFYTRHYFTCEITGTSCLTFFQALDSEESQFKYVEERFPIKLREPVARFLHFNSVKRLDALVESVYARFKNDFFPGEVVFLRKNKDSNVNSHQTTPAPEESISSVPITSTVSMDNSYPQFQKPYIIKEKAQFNAAIDSNTGEIIVPAYAKYMLIEESNVHSSLIADQTQIYRDRSSFTKHLIKCFCKITLTRASSKMGAPWCVKEEYLPIYGLTMEWPIDMLKYKEDEPKPEEKTNNNNNKRSRSHAIEENQQIPQDQYVQNESLQDQSSELTNDDSDGKKKDSEEKPSKKKKKTDDEIKKEEDEVAVEEAAASSAPITVIMEDLLLPYQGSPHIFERLTSYNNLLEELPLSENVMKPFKNFEKLLQVYQFFATFGRKIYISEFNLDQFITTLKCTDPYEMKGEVVYVEYHETPVENDLDESSESDWVRNPESRNLIKLQKNDRITYKIQKDEPASDEVLDNINNNGTALIIELFVSLLRLFMDENGDWVTLVTEEWIEEDKLKDIKTGEDNSKEDGIKEEDDSEDINSKEIKVEEDTAGEEENEGSTGDLDAKLEKCLNYRNVNWAERLAKRQFNNNFWLLILLGILQDSMHIPTYTDIVHNFTEKVIPEEISASQLPKQMWKNFCRNLTLDEKLDILWILVDLSCNYSPDIKNAIEESLELCGQLRSERFKISKDVKTEQNQLSMLLIELSQLNQVESNPEIEQRKTELEQKIEEQKQKVDGILMDKSFLEMKLLENDIQRLKPLGMDRYGNLYFWLELNGIHKKESSEQDSTEEINYHSGRLWVRGPNPEVAKIILHVTDEQLDNWRNIYIERGSAAATLEVFNIGKEKDGSYCYVDGDVRAKLVDENGVLNSLVELTPIQRKIIDETPSRLLLSDTQWYSFDDYEDVKSLMTWLDTWGRREHDLLRQFRPIESIFEDSFILKNKVINNKGFQQRESSLLKEFKENELTESELNPVDEGGEHSSSSDQNDDSKDETELEDIVEEIMKLDDCSKTRQILNQIQELESRRDQILEKIQARENSQRPGARVQLRAEKKRIKTTRESKIEKQSEILTDLLNLRHFQAMEDVIKWKNTLANKVWGTALRKNASGGKKTNIIDTVESRFKEILDRTSRTSSISVTN
ncbi:hypothetical protein Kpol_1002p41 [Vanderwaltozyma polyspora DSM 70294]|uniref:WAC domain-containing protein n=1 Tax=Vanderwaltozyma polyspora (strain ATCC 22028 / DSM 70294 / BCRC 21397 / CBS 2163 / NBRC 10782 / NRRL Y-8283 / UCD 57-17) TaxID=436907 RepID=A7TE72_VANPO|nr:uncharacterized protein Kpol_1002p41 [Vanderwaltozyma polyspora DSM 70294]EDO19394.1 hypothetical protein Kpol_1002p41 [Vanderwaltozyma polyspora DSM 70294]